MRQRHLGAAIHRYGMYEYSTCILYTRVRIACLLSFLFFPEPTDIRGNGHFCIRVSATHRMYWCVAGRVGEELGLEDVHSLECVPYGV